MKTSRRLKTSLIFLAGLSVAACGPVTAYRTPQVYYPVDAVQEYSQRSNTIALGAGNDQDVNSRIQMVDPWPPYSADTRIPGNGERMAGAVERYRDVSKIRTAPQPLPLSSTSSVTTGVGPSQ
jgi:hypothetical protein